jgi:hypothetical protein
MTPTARALIELRKLGYIPWVVESRISNFVKRDLYNCVDILAIKGTETLAVQVTAGSAHANRVAKVKANEYLALMLGAGWAVEVWSYRKSALTNRWVTRREPITYNSALRAGVIDAENEGQHE